MKKLLFGVTVISLLSACANNLTIKMVGTVKDKTITDSGCILKIEVSKDIELTAYTKKCDYNIGDRIFVKKDL